MVMVMVAALEVPDSTPDLIRGDRSKGGETPADPAESEATQIRITDWQPRFSISICSGFNPLARISSSLIAGLIVEVSQRSEGRARRGLNQARM